MDPGIVAALIGAAAVVVAAIIGLLSRSVRHGPPSTTPSLGPLVDSGAAAESETKRTTNPKKSGSHTKSQSSQSIAHNPNEDLLQTPKIESRYSDMSGAELEASLISDIISYSNEGDDIVYRSPGDQ